MFDLQMGIIIKDCIVNVHIYLEEEHGSETLQVNVVQSPPLNVNGSGFQ